MTKMMKRHLCLLLAAVMVCALLPLSGSAQAAPAPQAEETEAIPQRGVYEVDVLREENVKHFALPDGTYQAVVYGEPIHELDENGQWQEIDNSLYLGNAREQSFMPTQREILLLPKALPLTSPCSLFPTAVMVFLCLLP